MFINQVNHLKLDKKQKTLIDALNKRKYLKFNSGTYVGEIEVKAVDSRMTTLTCRGEKFAEVVYQNDFLDDVTSNQTNFLIEEIVTYNTVAPTASYRRFLNEVIFSNLLGCGVSIDDVPLMKVSPFCWISF